MDEKEKAFDEKVKRFNRNAAGILVNMCVSMATTILIHILLLH